MTLSGCASGPYHHQSDRADSKGIDDFFAGEGCAIGPTTRHAALAEGFQESDIDALVSAAKLDEQTVVTGEWVVLPPDMCTIRLPSPLGALALSDPEVMAATSSTSAYYNSGTYRNTEDLGCFLSSPKLHDSLRQSRGWDDHTISIEYTRMLGRAIAQGNAAFYSDSPLRTPPGYQILKGNCANVPAMPEIRESNAFLRDHFDGLVRALGQSLACDSDVNLIMTYNENVAGTLQENTPFNAWRGLEIMTVAMGAGWYENMSATAPGAPRPPLCHYP
ncbi:hypothetical protein [Halomonas halocynthiae]|uniref:hypothetical protein n=1 Tax=Halomonas halocynthiae TaxID=176290 RepID=UPI000421982D|nr:hypothetical protein [Halomonas halocynthiae]